MHTSPQLLPPSHTPPLLSTAAVHRQWCALMGELGFDDRCLWVLILDRDGRPLPMLPRVEGLPALPGPFVPGNIMRLCDSLMASGDRALGKVAFLLSRPGAGEVTTSDQAWADVLEHAAREAALPIWPVHIAGDDKIVAYDLPLAA